MNLINENLFYLFVMNPYYKKNMEHLIIKKKTVIILSKYIFLPESM